MGHQPAALQNVLFGPRRYICKFSIYFTIYTVIWLLHVPVTMILTFGALEPTDNNGRSRLS